MGFNQKDEFMNRKLWFLKIFALGVALGIVVWAIEVLRHRDVQKVETPNEMTKELPSSPITAKVQSGPRDRKER